MNYRLYLVTNRYDLSDTEFLAKIDQACTAGVTLVQLREKEVSTRRYYDLAIKVKQITDRYHVPLIIDDRIDICLAINAAGVHIGNNELPVQVARQTLGANKILGVSAKSISAAQHAQKSGADYLGVGAIYPTQTKVVTQHTSITTLNNIIDTVDIPVIAIGGITEHRLESFQHTKIAGVAMVSELMKSKNISTKVTNIIKQLKEVIA